LTAAKVNNAAPIITEDTWGIAWSPMGLGVPLNPAT
jgi:hypothetical protein